MTDLDPDACDCFAHRLTGLGFDDDQQVLVWQLMAQAHMAGVGWMIAQLGQVDEQILADTLTPSFAYAAKQITPYTVNLCMSNVMRDRTKPMSAEVAEAVRGHR